MLAVSAGTARAEERSLDYSSWVRLHLPGDAPDSVQNALELAKGSNAHSLDEFLESFLEEIKSSGSEQDVAEWLYGKSVDHSIVRQDLRLRLMDVVSSVVLHRSLEGGLRTLVNPAKKRVGPGNLDAIQSTIGKNPRPTQQILTRVSDTLSSWSVISEEQPRGP